MATTLSSLVTETRLLSGLRDNQLYTDAELATMLSDLWQELFDRFVAANQHYRIKTFDFTLAGGVDGNSVDLPSDFQLGNGLEMDPTQPRPRSVPYLSNWLQRNNLGASVLNIGGGNACTDRQYCLVNSQLTVFPAERSNGDYRLHYTPMCETFLAPVTRSFAIVGANDTPIVPAPGSFPAATGAWVVTNAGFTDDMPVDGSVDLELTFTAPPGNISFSGAYPIVGISGPDLDLNSTYDEAGVTGLVSTAGFSGPAVGTGTYTYQPIGTISELPDYVDPWAIYLKLGTSIAIREAREQDCTDLERRFAAQRLRVDSLLTNRQEEPTQPPLTGGRSFWDDL